MAGSAVPEDGECTGRRELYSKLPEYRFFFFLWVVLLRSPNIYMIGTLQKSRV